MRTNLIESRQIRVFISSTFQDMQDEREYLMRHTFPVLKQLAAKRDVALTELDLRWGITEEEAETGKIVEICLREIENSIPFFIGIIGNRYGWIPEKKDIGQSVTDRFPQVRGYIEKHLSVTDMEMQFGVLNRDEDMHAYFYIKEQEEAQDSLEMLNRLKECVRVSRYPDSTYDSPEDLGEQVKEAFIQLLDNIFPEKELSEAEKEAGTQRAFRNSLCRNYIREEHNFDAIDKWLEYSDSPQFVITGASGMGKSALIANWIKQKEETKTFPYHIVYHFVGNGGNEGSHRHVAHALAGTIQAAYGFEKDKYRNDNDELDNLFQKVASEGDCPLLVVLDAVNQIADEENAKQLNWLPIPPKNVRILFSTLEDDKTMDVFRNRKYPIFTLLPLNLDRRRQLVETYLRSYGKKLKDEQITRIITDTQCENTLVLKTLLDELVNFGIFERLDERINYFLRPNTVEQFYQTLLESYEMEFPFTEHVLCLIALSRSGLSEDELLRITKLSPLHWSQFYCSFYSHLTVSAGLITFGHTYIRSAVETRYALNAESVKNKTLREEIISLFEGQVTPRTLYELPYQYYALHDDERLHDVLMDINVFLCLFNKDEFSLTSYWIRLQGKYSMEEYIPLAIESKNKSETFFCFSSFCRLSVVNPELSLKFAEQILNYINENADKANVFLYLGLSEYNLGHLNKSLDYYLKALNIREENIADSHLDAAVLLNNIGIIYRDLGEYPRALKYFQRALNIQQVNMGYWNSIVATYLNNVGMTFWSIGDYQKALEYVYKAFEIRRSVFGDRHPDTASSYNNLGIVYSLLGDYKKDLDCQFKAFEIHKSVFGDRHPHTASSYNNLGRAFGSLGDYKNNLYYTLKSLEIFQSIFGDKHPETVTAYGNVGMIFGRLGNFHKALEYNLKAMELNRGIFGDNHPDTAYYLGAIGSVYGELGNYEKALKYKLKALEMHQAIFVDTNPNTIEYYNSVGYTYGCMGEYKIALKYGMEALEISKRIFGERHIETAKLFNNIGNYYKESGDHEQSLKYLLQALEIRQDILGDKHPVTGESFNNVGCSYDDLGDHEKALEYLKKALKIHLEKFGEEHHYTISCFENIGYNYVSLGNYLNALECFLKVLEIRQTLFGDMHVDTGWSCCNVGAVYRNLGNYGKALEYINKAKGIAQGMEDIVGVALYANRLALTYKAAGDIATAIAYYQEAAEMYAQLGKKEEAEENRKLAEELS